MAGRAGRLSGNPMGQGDVFRVIGRLAEAAGICMRIGRHSFRATGITEYPHPHRVPQLQGHWYHRVPAQRKTTGGGTADGQSRVGPDDRAA